MTTNYQESEPYGYLSAAFDSIRDIRDSISSLGGSAESKMAMRSITQLTERAIEDLNDLDVWLEQQHHKNGSEGRAERG